MIRYRTFDTLTDKKALDCSIKGRPSFNAARVSRMSKTKNILPKLYLYFSCYSLKLCGSSSLKKNDVIFPVLSDKITLMSEPNSDNA